MSNFCFTEKNIFTALIKFKHKIVFIELKNIKIFLFKIINQNKKNLFLIILREKKFFHKFFIFFNFKK